MYEAVGDTDGSACAAEASRVARGINDLGGSTNKRRRRQTTNEEVEPIFNFMVVATALEDSQPSTNTGNGGDNGGAGMITAYYSLLFTATLLVFLML